jgi:hypothetical protein
MIHSFSEQEVFWQEVFDEANNVCKHGIDQSEFSRRLVHLVADWAWREGVTHPFAREMIDRTILEVGTGLQPGSRDLDSLGIFIQRVHHKWNRICQKHRFLYLVLTSDMYHGEYFLKAFDEYENGASAAVFMSGNGPPMGSRVSLRSACQRVRVRLDREDLTKRWISNWFYEFFNGANDYEQR